MLNSIDILIDTLMAIISNTISYSSLKKQERASEEQKRDREKDESIKEKKEDNENLVAARKAITDNDILSPLECQLCVASTVVISDLDNIENYKYRNIRLYTEGVLRKMLEIYPAGFDFLNIDVIDDWSRAYIDSVLIDADINNLENTVFNIKQYDKTKCY